MERCILRDADLFGVLLVGAEIRRSTFEGASLEWVEMHGATLSEVSLEGISCSGADFSVRSARDVSHIIGTMTAVMNTCHV